MAALGRPIGRSVVTTCSRHHHVFWSSPRVLIIAVMIDRGRRHWQLFQWSPRRFDKTNCARMFGIVVVTVVGWGSVECCWEIYENLFVLGFFDVCFFFGNVMIFFLFDLILCVFSLLILWIIMRKNNIVWIFFIITIQVILDLRWFAITAEKFV